MTLSRKNSVFLNDVLNYGGYVTTSMLEPYFDNITYNARYKRLKKLSADGYLKIRNRFRSNSDKEGDTYQITTKTARHFNDENNYGRFQHREEVAYRRMIRAAFLFEVHNIIHDRVVSSSHDKYMLLKSLGVSDADIPYKANANGRFPHIEEHIVDFTIGTGDVISDDSVTLTDDGNTILLVQSDKYYFNIDVQIEQIKRRYENMISNNPDLSFKYIIVFDDPFRHSTFHKAVDNIGFNTVRLNTISDTLVTKYLKYLFLDSKDKRYDLADGVKRGWILSFDGNVVNFSDDFLSQTRNKMLEFTKNEAVDIESSKFKNHVEGIVRYGHRYIDRRINEMKDSTSPDELGRSVGDLFRDIALVESSGRIYLDSKTQKTASEIVCPYLLKKPVVFDNKCG